MGRSFHSAGETTAAWIRQGVETEVFWPVESLGVIM